MHVTSRRTEIVEAEDNTRQGDGTNQVGSRLQADDETPVSEQANVTVRCSNVCGNVNAKSCSKTFLVRFHRLDYPDNYVDTYAIIDDQSNKSLISPALIDTLRLEGRNLQFTLTTCHELDTPCEGRIISGTSVTSSDGKCTVALPDLYEVGNIPGDTSEVATPDIARAWTHLNSIAHQIQPINRSCNVGLLIGRDTPRLHKVREYINGPDNAPWAQRLDMGWTIIGQVCPYVPTQHLRSTLTKSSPQRLSCHCALQIENGPLSVNFDHLPGSSHEDREFLRLMEDEITVNQSGNLEMPLPFRDANGSLPNNYRMAEARIAGIKKRITRNVRERDDYTLFMKNLLDKGHASPVPRKELQGPKGKVWYLPHFIVYHPKKPHKPGRVVFDSSAKFDGVSLNSVLMSGPDLTNQLIGVLLRFRRQDIAAMCDVEQMFHSFYVTQDHRDYLRFLWYEDNDSSKPIIPYRMNVHLFGNVSSPAVANFGLRYAAKALKHHYDPAVYEFIDRCFYVDDGLLSRATPEDAIQIIKSAQKLLATFGIRLHKVVSNSPQLLDAIPKEDRDTAIKEIRPGLDPLPAQRSLGILWDPNTDTFKLEVPKQPKPTTRRGMLSSTFGIYDPLGYASPVILRGKLILRELGNADWDSPVPETIKTKWIQWRNKLKHLESIKIPRGFTPPGFPDNVTREIHGYSDASTDGIGYVIYLKTITSEGEIHTSFVKGKAKLAPANLTSVPRLEMEAAVLLVEEAKAILAEIDLPIDKVTYHTDSKVVLGWIGNDLRRFHTWVSNRIQRIRSLSTPSQWEHVCSEHNPADLASRSVDASILEQTMWLHGPAALRTREPRVTPEEYPVDENDPELKRVKTARTDVQQEETVTKPSMTTKLSKFSSWTQARKAIATLRARLGGKLPNGYSPSYDQVEEAGLEIIRWLQIEEFHDETKLVRSGKSLPKNNPIAPLAPFWDAQANVIRVGGKLTRSAGMTIEEKHPLLIPKCHHITDLIIRHYHNKVQHLGRSTTLNEVRQNGFWIPNGRGAVGHLINSCVTCRRLRGPFMNQKEADLPEDRITEAPPFSHVGMDIFGPFQVTTSRTSNTRRTTSNAKRWCIIYTCLYSRAVHIDSLENMETDALLNALRRFVCIRGPVNIYRSDQGTNLMGARRLLQLESAGIDTNAVKKTLADLESRWIVNPPHASNFGGVWERMIGTVRRIMNNMLLNLKRPLSLDQFSTFLAEASSIVNSRPLGTVSNDVNDLIPVCPNMILTSKTRSAQPPPGVFPKEDLYCRKRWRAVQHLADNFWRRFKREYLINLQKRSENLQPNRNARVGDIVMMKTDGPRIEWPIGLVEAVYPSEDNLVRKVDITFAKEVTRSVLTRPVNKLVLLMPVDNGKD